VRKLTPCTLISRLFKWSTMNKICRVCQKEKDESEFRLTRLFKGLDEGAYYRSECSVCEDIAKKQRMIAKKNAPPMPDKCQCCGKHNTNSTSIGKKRCSQNKLLVDHNHVTGKFRGWICRNCNQGIGKLGDNIDGLVKALNYLLNEKVNNENNQ